MPKTTEPASHFVIGRSRLMTLIIDSLHTLSISACWLNALLFIHSLMLSLLVTLSWIFHHKACKADSTYLRYTASHGWAISFENEDYLPIEIKPTTVTGRLLTVLHFKFEKRSNILVIFKDAMTANNYRRLIVLLKISG